MKKILTLGIVIVLVVGSALFLTSCKNTSSSVTPSAPPPAEETNKTTEEPAVKEEKPEEPKKTDDKPKDESNEVSNLPNPIVTIEMENGKKIVVELFPKYAPNTVNNFVTLAQSGYYDGLTFHRIVPGFVIQGGDPEGTGAGGPGYAIEGEFIENGFDQNLLSHTRGVISMARTMAPNSAGSQFFIVTDDAAIPSLDAKYAGFGMVVEGMDVVDEIVSAPRGPQDAPVDPIVMKKVTVDTQGVENWPAPVTIAE